MPRDAEPVDAKVRQVVEELKPYYPQQIILFGSYARDDANEYSDVDLIVISNVFETMPEERRFDELYMLTHGLYPDFHVYGFTSREFEQANPLTSLATAKQEGVPLLS